MFGEKSNMTEPNSKDELVEVLKKASRLARDGEVSQAQAILIPVVEKSQKFETLNLLAKIYAQQGNLDDAQDLWIKALQLNPSNLHVLKALKSCAISKQSGIQQLVFRYSGFFVAFCVWWLMVLFLILING